MALTAALPAEIRPAMRYFEEINSNISSRRVSIHAGRLFGVNTLIMASGPGAENARRAHELLHSSYNVSRIIIFGLAGATAPDLKPGDVVIPQQVALWDDGALTRHLDLSPISAEGTCIPGANATPGLICAQAPCPCGPEEKKALSTLGAGIVDMESHTAASIASERGVCASIIRAVSDRMVDDVPRDPAKDRKFAVAAKFASESNVKALMALLSGGRKEALP